MKITNLTAQIKNKHRVNVIVDGVYRFSLDVFQVGELGLRVGKEYSDAELLALETESQFGKTYARALEYCLSRPHSVKEVRDYLWRKTRPVRTKTGELKNGIVPEVAERVLERLQQKGYVSDEVFARWWVENRHLRKGASQRKLQSELAGKGVAPSIVERYLQASPRNDANELQKIITKKQGRYPDEQKLMQYLARQGFGYDAIREALAEVNC